jgi:hypothetical protein
MKDFKEYCHLEKDGEALYEAVREDVIRGLITKEALAVLDELKVTVEMSRGEILERLQNALGDNSEEGPVAKLANKESKRLGDIFVSERYKSELQNLKAAPSDVENQTKISLQQARDSAGVAYRGQIEILIQTLTIKWE